MQTPAETNRESLEIKQSLSVVVFACNTSIKLRVLTKTFIIVKFQSCLEWEKTRNVPIACCLIVKDTQEMKTKPGAIHNNERGCI